MIATEILTRYQAGDGLQTLMHAYHIGQPTLRRLLIAMGATIRPHGQHGRPSAYQSSSVAQRDIENHHGDPQYCKRCEILLRFDPGQHGYCRECLQHLHPLDAHQACTWLQLPPHTRWRATPARARGRARRRKTARPPPTSAAELRKRGNPILSFGLM